jgi:hypothetical protein
MKRFGAISGLRARLRTQTRPGNLRYTVKFSAPKLWVPPDSRWRPVRARFFWADFGGESALVAALGKVRRVPHEGDEIRHGCFFNSEDLTRSSPSF